MVFMAPENDTSDFHFIKISVVKSASLVNALLSAQPSQPIQQPPQQQLQQQQQNKQTAQPKAIGAWVTKPGALTAAQLIAAKTTPTTANPILTITATSISAPRENNTASLPATDTPNLAPLKLY
ncbi:hypothetical protein HK100_010255 [Physocladia obscura]|uniref:Uncharacterized protein n=1 Tax=Physocladia obscura TaxID=109957 RepID=A0AAD5TEW4_9FUNG|nr:hypothetical protein HK100_010255 [Physocladia obscura]